MTFDTNCSVEYGINRFQIVLNKKAVRDVSPILTCYSYITLAFLVSSLLFNFLKRDAFRYAKMYFCCVISKVQPVTSVKSPTPEIAGWKLQTLSHRKRISEMEV